jgi:pimeloyl-ACP methyl ester carboxylesterase
VLAHLAAGDGPRSLLLLHGFLGSGRNLLSLARAWSQAAPSLRLLLLDLTGHGASPPLRPGAGLFELGEDVLAAARSLGVHPPLVIAGHSLGGRVGLAAALAGPGMVGEVTLLDIAPGPIVGAESEEVVQALQAMPALVPDRAEMRRRLEATGLARPLVEWLLTNLVPRDGGYGWRFDRSALAELHPRVNAGDLWGAVDRRACTVRAVRGARSRYVSDADVAHLRAAGCEVETLAGAGHFLHVDAPRELLATLLRFHGSE